MIVKNSNPVQTKNKATSSPADAKATLTLADAKVTPNPANAKATPTPADAKATPIPVDTKSTAHFSKTPLYGIDSRGQISSGCSLQTVYQEFGKALAETDSFYLYKGDVVYVDNRSIIPVTRGTVLTPQAELIINNYFYAVDGIKSSKSNKESVIKNSFLRQAFSDNFVRSFLNRVDHIYSFPVVEKGGRVLLEGYIPSRNTLILGSFQLADLPDPNPIPKGKVVESLPPHLKALLGEFQWRSEDDLKRFLGYLASQIYTLLLEGQPRPILMIMANQKDSGKTLLARLVSQLFDGKEPTLWQPGNNRTLEGKFQTVLERASGFTQVFDNLTESFQSTWLESFSLLPSFDYQKPGMLHPVSIPNNYRWILTSNQIRISPDLLSRAIVIRLKANQDTLDISYKNNPIEYCRQHRAAILGELLTLACEANLQQLEHPCKPDGIHLHRCREWAILVQSFLHYRGFGPVSMAFNEDDTNPISRMEFFQGILVKLYGCKNELFRTSFPRKNVPFATITTREIIEMMDWRDLAYFSESQKNSPRSMSIELGKILTNLFDKSMDLDLRVMKIYGLSVQRFRMRSNRIGYYFLFQHIEVDSEE